MKKGNLEIYKTIQKYLEKKLSPEEVINFEKRLEIEKEAREAFALVNNIESIKFDRSDKLKEGLAILKRNREQTKKQHFATRNYKRPLAIAASILFIILAYFVIQTLSKPTLFEQVVNHDKLEITTLNRQEDLKTNLENEFNNKNYRKALKLSQEYLTISPKDFDVQFATGICYLETGNHKEALGIFKKYSTSKADNRINGNWYTALTYLKMRDYSNCRKELKILLKKGYRKDEINRLLDLLKNEKM